MKTLLMAVALAVTAGGIAAPPEASAQGYYAGRHHDRDWRDRRHDRRDWERRRHWERRRYWDRRRGWDRGRYAWGYGWRHHRRCDRVWRHHHRVRRCW